MTEIETLKQEVSELKSQVLQLKETVTGQLIEKRFTVAQVAAKLGLTPNGVNFHIRQGNIKALGKRCKKILESELNRYIETIKKPEVRA
jgi:hypothetical protein